MSYFMFFTKVALFSSSSLGICITYWLSLLVVTRTTNGVTCTTSSKKKRLSHCWVVMQTNKENLTGMDFLRSNRIE